MLSRASLTRYVSDSAARRTSANRSVVRSRLPSCQLQSHVTRRDALTHNARARHCILFRGLSRGSNRDERNRVNNDGLMPVLNKMTTRVGSDEFTPALLNHLIFDVV